MRIPQHEILTILTQVGQALSYAHQRHIIHRDMKPENILFNARNEALLADFGLATSLSTASVKYVDNAGTPRYMPPEQFQGHVSMDINGSPSQDFVPTPPYNTSYWYQFTMHAPGGPLSFSICDHNRSDNHGALTVTVTQD